jgi:hypothetical protein
MPGPGGWAEATARRAASHGITRWRSCFTKIIGFRAGLTIGHSGDACDRRTR